MRTRMTLDRERLIAFCRRHRIRKLSLFGSVLREDFGPESDIDVLVEFEPEARVGLIGLQRMERELGDLFGRKVDLNTPGFLSPYFREKVLSEAETLYDGLLNCLAHPWFAENP